MTDVLELIWAKVEKTDTCWLWTGLCSERGYPRQQIPNRESRGGLQKSVRVPKALYEALVGPIPPGRCLIHTCRVRRCVNPAHMRLGTSHDAGRAHTKTECLNGHEYKPGSYYTQGQKGRVCKECHADRVKRYQQRKRAQNGRTVSA